MQATNDNPVCDQHSDRWVQERGGAEGSQDGGRILGVQEGGEREGVAEDPIHLKCRVVRKETG